MSSLSESAKLSRQPVVGLVTPFARALSLLSAFTPQERWLGLGELAVRAGLPPSTAGRLARALAACGYLHHDTGRRQFRLTASVMTLGYGAAVNSEVRKAARLPMAAFARQNDLHVMLCGRERLDLIVLDHCESPHRPLSLSLDLGVRLGIATSPVGWTLLAVLPDIERQYLMESLEHRATRDWVQQRRRANEAIAQVRERGWCSASPTRDESLTVVATPLKVTAQSPMVLACVGESKTLGRARIDREVGPRLAALAAGIADHRNP